MTSSEMRSASKDACVLESLIACQEGLSLPVRRLFISAVPETKLQGGGGKIVRERVGSTHKHYYAGSIFGCVLGAVIGFVTTKDERVCDVMRRLRGCLEPVGKDAMSCLGEDAIHLQRGFASHHAIRGQLPYLHESKMSVRIDSRYGKKSVALGVSACVYFVLSSLATRTENSVALLYASSMWMRRCYKMLSHWNTSSHVCGVFQFQALEAERRALERGAHAFDAADAEAKRTGLDIHNTLRLKLAYVRKAMWPPGRVLDAKTQAALLDWVNSDSFTKDIKLQREVQPSMNITINVPLSAIPMLPEHSKMGVGSSCDSQSSAGSSLLSLSSVNSDVCEREAVNALSALLREEHIDT